MSLYTKLRNIKWEILWRIHPNHRYNIIKTGLKPGYYDVDERMLHGMMSLLVGFVETEIGGLDKFKTKTQELFEMVDEGDTNTKDQLIAYQEAIAIYTWWTEQRHHEIREFEEYELESFNDAEKRTETKLPDGSILHTVSNFDPERTLVAFNKEKDLINKDTEMMTRLVSIRGSLWT